jgi:hypothetical protein
MKRTTERTRLVIRRETLRRLVAGDLAHVAGGRYNNNWCTYAASGCQGQPDGTEACPPGASPSLKCDSNVCQ